MHAFQKFTESVQATILSLDRDRKMMLSAWRDMIDADGAPIFPLDLLASGAAERALSATSAMKHFVETWNMVSAQSLLRTHIDTSLRF